MLHALTFLKMSNFGYEHSKPNLYAGHQNDNYYWTHADARTEYNLTRTEIDCKFFVFVKQKHSD